MTDPTSQAIEAVTESLVEANTRMRNHSEAYRVRAITKAVEKLNETLAQHGDGLNIDLTVKMPPVSALPDDWNFTTFIDLKNQSSELAYAYAAKHGKTFEGVAFDDYRVSPTVIVAITKRLA
jgi:phage tail protein X